MEKHNVTFRFISLSDVHPHNLPHTRTKQYSSPERGDPLRFQVKPPVTCRNLVRLFLRDAPLLPLGLLALVAVRAVH